MGNHKAIASGKEHRKDYTGAKSYCRSCRNHGSCSYCRSGRTYNDTKERSRLDGQEDEFFGYWMQPCEMDAISNHFEKLYDALGFEPTHQER